jgi:hypothetical protein
MGGNAVAKHVKTVRLDVDKYKELEAKTLNALRKEFPDGRFNVVTYFTDKKDFGDVDLMYNVDDNADFLVRLTSLLKTEFNTDFDLPFVRNGSVTSVGVPVDEKEEDFFQLDFLYYNKEDWEHAEFFLNYNDVGNLLGRVARFAGFKLSDRGLLYPYKDEHGHVVKDVLVTKDPLVTMQVLKLDKALYDKGMDSMEDVYHFVMSSDYFVRETFLAENQNNGLRKREKKRGAYQLFLEYLDGVELPSTTYSFEDKHLARLTALEYALDRVPLFEERCQDMQKESDLMKMFKMHFNGKLVAELTGLENKELGQFMKFVQGEDKEQFVSFVVFNPQSKVNNFVLEKFKEFQNS